MNLNLLSVLGFMILLLAIAGMFLTQTLIGVSSLALAIQFMAIGLMIWSRLTFGMRSFHASARPTEGGIVTRGPYRYLRHPIYAAVLYVVWVGMLSHLSIIPVILTIIATVGSFMRIIAEERLLVEKYPEYTEYAAKTKRVIPFIL